MPSSIQVTATVSLQDNGAVTFEVDPSLSFGGDLACLLALFLSHRPGSQLATSGTRRLRAATRQPLACPQ
ncbi:Uncharacterised protein [Mycobacteroides abscessus]|nr:Uncharacterised protein [Mycobacteroides abscessus]